MAQNEAEQANRHDRLRWLTKEFADAMAAASESRTERIALLRRFARVVVYKPHRKVIGATRRDFNSLRRRDFATRGLCVGCFQLPRHRHHVIQTQHGGDNARDNWVWLCRACHEAIHDWLGDVHLPPESYHPVTDPHVRTRMPKRFRVAKHWRAEMREAVKWRKKSKKKSKCAKKWARLKGKSIRANKPQDMTPRLIKHPVPRMPTAEGAPE